MALSLTSHVTMVLPSLDPNVMFVDGEVINKLVNLLRSG